MAAKKANLIGEHFGVEIEVAGQSKQAIREAVAEAIGGNAFHLYDDASRRWKVVYDGSINRVNGQEGGEVVTPILTYCEADLNLLRTVIRKLREIGCVPHHSCGIHIHVNGQGIDVKSLTNLTKMVHRNEDIMYDAIGTSSIRRGSSNYGFARPMENGFIEKVASGKIKSKSDLNEAWYGRYNFSPGHYDGSRYHGLNLHNIWEGSKETVEFRYFNASLHSGKIIGWIQFCLCLIVKAKSSKSARWTKIETDNPRYNFRCFLLNIGMIGDEFKSARYHLIKNLAGCSAFRHGRPAA